MTLDLGSLEKVDLREIWQQEATGDNAFTKWLAKAENMKLLSKAIGIDISTEDTEADVGDFSVDILAKEEGTGKTIIIENQLEATNHDHLGKIITYASGRDAAYVIWIVKHARAEHQKAIEWLNEHCDIPFFLLEIAVYKIGESLPAPAFRLIEAPNDWAQNVKTAGALTEGKRLYMEFWQGFVDHAFDDENEFSKTFSKRKVLPQNWYDLSIGKQTAHIAFTVSPTKNEVTASVYVVDDKDYFHHLKDHETQIADAMEMPLIWREATKDSRILACLSDVDVNDEDTREKCYDWLMDVALKFKKAIKGI